MTSSIRRAGVTVIALCLSLVTLYAGRFIRFDDTSGFGSERWIMPWAWVAALLAMAALAVAGTDRVARRTLGGALACLVVWLVVECSVDDGFRFVYDQDEGGDVFIVEVVLGLVALALLIPAYRTTGDAVGAPPHPGPTAWARVVGYVVILVVTMFLVFGAGVAHFAATKCRGPDFGGECDLAGIEGVTWAGADLLLVTGSAALWEIRRARRRRARRHVQSTPG